VIARRIVVSGRVQGVGFRLFAARAAGAHGVRGWVRNLSDGRVEVLGEGEPDGLERFQAEIRRGPRHAVVDDVRVTEETPGGLFEGFDVRD
jgi:acylphosphatase